MIWGVYSFVYDLVESLIPYRDHHSILVERIRDSTPNSSSKKVLDIGSGTGNLARALIRQDSELDLYLLDSSKAMLRMAREKLRDHSLKINYYHGPAEEIIDQFDENFFSAVVINNVLYAIPRRLELMRKVLKKTKIGGHVIISDPLPNFSAIKVFRVHFLGKGIIKKILLYVEACLLFPVIMIFISINFFIDYKAKVSHEYLFQSPELLISSLSDLSFRIIEVKKSYADQNYLVVLEKV